VIAIDGHDSAGPGPRRIDVPSWAALPQVVAAVAGTAGRPVLVSVGGAGGMAPEHLESMADLVRQCVVPVIERTGGAIVDGGTDSGVMRVVGQARQAAGATFPLIGVAAEGTVVPAAEHPDVARLEPNHTCVLQVEGSRWRDEAAWLAEVATILAGDRPSVTLLVNGGDIAYQDARFSLDAGRPVIVVAGTGRTADAIAAARAGDGGPGDERATQLAASGLVQVLQLDDPAAFAAALELALGTPARP
jgi:hypothetical protein